MQVFTSAAAIMVAHACVIDEFAKMSLQANIFAHGEIYLTVDSQIIIIKGDNDLNNMIIVISRIYLEDIHSLFIPGLKVTFH